MFVFIRMYLHHVCVCILYVFALVCEGERAYGCGFLYLGACHIINMCCEMIPYELPSIYLYFCQY